MENIFLGLKEKMVLQQDKDNIDKDSKELLVFLQDIKNKLDYAEVCLNFTSDDLLIDSIIYEIISLQKKYDYYLRIVKQRGIVISSPNILQKFPAS